MIRPFLRHIAAPLLDSLGPVVVRAARQALDDADAAHLSEARAIGERDEARAALVAERRFAKDDAIRWQGMVAAATDDTSDQVRTLSAEIERLRIVESNGRADDDVYTLAAQTLDDLRDILPPKDGVSLYRTVWNLREDFAAVYRIGWAAIVERDAAGKFARELAAKAVDDGAMILALQSSEINAARVIGDLRARIRGLETQADALEEAGVKLGHELADWKRVAGEKEAARAGHRFEIDDVLALCEENGIKTSGMGLRGVIKQLFAELETQLDARADVAPVEAKSAECAWCLGDATLGGLCTGFIEGTSYPVCEEHGRHFEPTFAQIKTRVLQRANCCPTRRTSPNPLDVACALGCGADVGEECHPGREPVGG